MKGIKSGFLWLKPSGKQLEELSNLIVHGKIKPIISKKLCHLMKKGLEKLIFLSEGQHVRSKIVIKVE